MGYKFNYSSQVTSYCSQDILITKKKLSFLDGLYVSAVAVNLYLMSNQFMTFFQSYTFKVKGMKTAPMIFEDSWGQVKVQFN